MSTTGVNKSHWNWTKTFNISMYVVEILVVIAIIRFFMQLFGGSGGVAAGVADIFGNAANFVNGIFNGCSKQEDCSKGRKNSDDCKKIHNCTYREVTTGNPGPGPAGERSVKTCVSSNGTPTGGGISTLGCFAGIGAIITGIVAVLSVFGIAIYKMFFNNKNKSVEVSELLGGGPTTDAFQLDSVKLGEVCKQITEELMEKKGQTGEITSEELLRKFGRSASLKKVLNKIIADGGDIGDIQDAANSVREAVSQELGLEFGAYDADANRVFEEEAHNIYPKEMGSAVVYEAMIRRALSTNHNVVIGDVFKTFLKKHINRLSLSINTTEQAVLEGNYNTQTEIKDKIDRAINTAVAHN